MTKKERCLRLGIGGLALAVAGLCYGWFAGHYFGIPCLFYQLTGLKCPGCGTTRMVLALLQGDISEAFRQNAAMLCLLPVMVLLAVRWGIRYIQNGSRQLLQWENLVCCGMVAVLIVYDVVRNLAQIL